MSTILLSTYFSKNPHPNDVSDHTVVGRDNDGRVWQNDFRYIEKWYNSVKRLNLQAVVFYDNLSDEFVEEYQTKQIRFIKVPTPSIGYNCYRHFVFYEFLKGERHDFVFHSDISDVVVVQDPSKIFEENSSRFFVGKDSFTLRQFPILSECAREFHWNAVPFFIFSNEPLVNMGVFGARYDDALLFYKKMCEVRKPTIDKWPTLNADMMVGNHIIYNNLIADRSEFCIGEPLTSNFKAYEDTRKDVYFIHK